jgi:methionyl-tRNA formyltransferase
MKVIFMGAPAFAVPTLMALAGTGAELSAVYTRAPKRAGRRGLEITKCPVHLAAESIGLRVETPSTLRDPQAQRVFCDYGADIAIVAAYGLLLPAEILTAPRLGCFNLHASLLPRWRGAAPVQRAIMAGDSETGVAIMKMEVGLDTGPIAGEMRTLIDPSETGGELTAVLAELAAQTLRENWNALIGGELEFAAQSADGVAYAAKVRKAEAPIDWSASAVRVRNHIHGLSPFPGAVAGFQVGGAVERLKILRAEIAEPGGRPGEILDDRMTIACAKGSIRALQVQRAGRSVISGAEFMRSGATPPGATLIAPH